MTIGQRLITLGLIALTLTAIPTVLYSTAAWEEFKETKHSANGIEPAKALLDVIRLTQQHRGLSAVMLNGNLNAAPRRLAKNTEAQQAYDRMSTLLEASADSPVTFQNWDGITRQWARISQQIGSNALSAGQSFAAHNDLVTNLIEIAGRLDIEFGISHGLSLIHISEPTIPY